MTVGVTVAQEQTDGCADGQSGARTSAGGKDGRTVSKGAPAMTAIRKRFAAPTSRLPVRCESVHRLYQRLDLEGRAHLQLEVDDLVSGVPESSKVPGLTTAVSPGPIISDSPLDVLAFEMERMRRGVAKSHSREPQTRP